MSAIHWTLRLWERRASLKSRRTSIAGNISIEMAVLVLVFIALGIGAFDFGRYALLNAAVTGAARAGSQYGMQDQTTAADIGAIVQAAQDNAGANGATISISARRFCDCPGEGEVVCGASCTDGGYTRMFVEVTAQDDLDLLFEYPGVSQSLPISSVSTIRVR